MVISLVLAVLFIGVNYEKHPRLDDYFGPLIFLLAALLNLLFTIVFVKNEPKLSEEAFAEVLAAQKEKFPKWSFGTKTIKVLRCSVDPRSSCFFIPNKVWTYIFFTLALICLIGTLI